MPSMPDLSRMTLTPPKRLGSGDLGGFLAGLLAYALVLNYLRGGPEGVKGWVGAKFLNRPYEAPAKPRAKASDKGLTSTKVTVVEV